MIIDEKAPANFDENAPPPNPCEQRDLNGCFLTTTQIIGITYVFFIPRRESAIAAPIWGPIVFTYIPQREPKEVQLFLLMSYFVLGHLYWTFNLRTFFCLFQTLKMFYPREGLCKADTEGGPI